MIKQNCEHSTFLHCLDQPVCLFLRFFNITKLTKFYFAKKNWDFGNDRFLHRNIHHYNKNNLMLMLMSVNNRDGQYK